MVLLLVCLPPPLSLSQGHTNIKPPKLPLFPLLQAHTGDSQVSIGDMSHSSFISRAKLSVGSRNSPGEPQELSSKRIEGPMPFRMATRGAKSMYGRVEEGLKSS